jgi:hypothetical protein
MVQACAIIIFANAASFLGLLDKNAAQRLTDDRLIHENSSNCTVVRSYEQEYHISCYQISSAEGTQTSFCNNNSEASQQHHGGQIPLPLPAHELN